MMTASGTAMRGPGKCRQGPHPCGVSPATGQVKATYRCYIRAAWVSGRAVLLPMRAVLLPMRAVQHSVRSPADFPVSSPSVCTVSGLRAQLGAFGATLLGANDLMLADSEYLFCSVRTAWKRLLNAPPLQTGCKTTSLRSTRLFAA